MATLQDRLRHATDGLMGRIGQRVWSWGIHPDAITVAGTLLAGVASFFIASGHFHVAGAILIIALPLDALDGAVARAMNQPNRRFGGVLDSTLDRYADGLLFGALMFYFQSAGQPILAIASLLTLNGSFTTSYVRTRSALAGYEVKDGLMDRLLRVVVLLVGLLFPVLLPFIVVVLAVTTNLTTLQRLVSAEQNLE